MRHALSRIYVKFYTIMKHRFGLENILALPNIDLITNLKLFETGLY